MSMVIDQVLHERSPVPAEGNIQTAPDTVHVHKTLELLLLLFCLICFYLKKIYIHFFIHTPSLP